MAISRQKNGAVGIIKKRFRGVCLQSTLRESGRDLWAGRGSTSLTTAQNLVLNRRKMSVPCWDTGGLNFLQWKRLKVRRKSYSHIDYFLTNNYITHKIIDPAIHAISISDHVLISITFLAEHQPLPPPRWWSHTSLLNDIEFVKYFKKEWTFFVESYSTEWIYACTLRETVKSVMRDKILSYCSNENKKQLAWEKK